MRASGRIQCLRGRANRDDQSADQDCRGGHSHLTREPTPLLAAARLSGT
jgi:hypothetical protein